MSHAGHYPVQNVGDLTRSMLLAAADEARAGHLRWPHDEMCLARWDGFRDAACIALGMEHDDLERLLDGGGW